VVIHCEGVCLGVGGATRKNRDETQIEARHDLDLGTDHWATKLW
jgi:hypothetical protein